AEQTEDRRPKEQAGLLSRVQRGPQIERREIAAGARRDVLETEVVTEDCDFERDHRDEQRAEQRQRRVARALLQVGALLRAADESGYRSPEADQEGEPQGELAEQTHLRPGNG